MEPTDAQRRARAGELIATHFDRTMKACTSPRGVYCDLSLAFVFSALPLVLLVRQAAGNDLHSGTTVVLVVLALAPLLLSLAISASLRGARDQVIDWIAAHPFPLENLNSLLLGISDEFEVSFQPGVPLPSREELQKLLNPISEDTIATEIHEETRTATVRIGVLDSKRLPLRTNHLRYVRFQRIVDEVLLPLHRERPIASVRLI
ncbi:MAG: hypothetical protein RMJ98_10495 [Myxococcales bacterium]|nr:hypothetical protein [Polyangiaceae bacterium]MDW8249715.1 hypothetical protein [Myxococcales bacterium]